MKNCIVRILLLTGLCCCVLQAHAQGLGSDLPTLSNLAFGWSSASGGNPAVDAMSVYAPNMLCVTQAGYRAAGEGFFCRLDFGDMRVTTNQNTALAAVGAGAVRLAHFRYASNKAHDLPFVNAVSQALGGVDASATLDGETLELSYAQPIGSPSTILGVSYVPIDSSNSKLIAPETGSISDGRYRGTGGGRVGVLQTLPHGWRIGANYSYLAGSATATFLAPTNPPSYMTQTDQYLTRKLDLGLAQQTTPRLQCYAAYSKTVASGGTLAAYHGEITAFGIRYQISPALMTQITASETNHVMGLFWKTRYGQFSILYAHRPIPNGEDYLGKGKGLAGVIDIAF